MTTNYLGLTSIGSYDWGLGPALYLRTYTCPGSGNYSISALGAYVKATGAGGKIIIAICDSSYNLLAQGAAAITVTNADYEWIEHETLTVYESLTAGLEYYILVCCDSANVICKGTYSPYNAYVEPTYDCTDTLFYDPISSDPEWDFGVVPTLIEFNLRVSYDDLSDGKISILLSGSGNIDGYLRGLRSGSWIYQSAQLNAPTDAPSVASGSTGSLSGAFYAKYTYIDEYGNESNPSPASSVCTLSGQQLSVGCGPSSDVTVTQVGIYVLAPSSSLYKYVGTLSASTSVSTYSVSITETQIVNGEDITEINDPIPYGKYVALFGDRLCVAGDPSLADTTRVSNPMFHRQFDPQDYDRVVSGDGQPIKGFGKYYDSLIVAKTKSLYTGPSQGSATFYTNPFNPDYGVLGQPSMLSFLKRLAFFSKDGVYVETGNVPNEISEPIRHYIRMLNPANLTTTPPKQVSGQYSYFKKLFFAVREASGVGENDTILVYNWENGSWTIYKNIEATYLASVQKNENPEYLWGGDSNGQLYKFGQPSDSYPNSDYHNGLAQAIDAWVETPWIHLPRAKGLSDWDTSMTEGVWLNLYAGGECLAGSSYITMQTSVAFDFQTTYNATFTTTHTASQWPAVTCDPKMIESFAGNYGNFQYVKFRIGNNNLHEHFKIHKLVFGFRVRPIPGK